MINPMELSPQQIVSLYRTTMSERSSIASTGDPRYDIFQLKFDGWWVAVRIVEQSMQIITSGADIRKTIVINNPSHVSALLIGEWMYGTNWAASHNPGKIFIHDLVCWDEGPTPFECYSGLERSYGARLLKLEELQHRFADLASELQLVQTYEIDRLPVVWDNTSNFEGVVLKNSLARLGVEMDACKIKRTFDEDYVVMGITEGAGRLVGKMGALQGGQYVDGKLIPVCSVGGGFTDAVRAEIWNDKEKYLGKVFQARGKGRFAGGALRHPNFYIWRDDKLPEQCVRRTK